MPAEPSDFGARLRRAREARGLSLKEVAAATKISPLVLDALERNDVSRLPGGLFSRAFVRAYAKEVGLDPEQTVRDFAERFADGDQTARVDEGVRVRSSSNDLNEVSGRSGLGWLGLAVTLLLVVAWIGVDRYYGSRSQPAATSPATARPAAEPGAASAPPTAAAPSSSQPTAGNVPAEPQPAQAAASSPPAPAPSEALSPPAPASPQVANPSSAPAEAQPTPGGPPAATASAPVAVDPSLPLQVVLSPIAPCWISAKVDGNRIVGRTVQPGERLQLSAATAIVLSAGDAAALSYTVNKAPGRALGKSGEVVTVVITTSNYRTFMTAGQ